MKGRQCVKRVISSCRLCRRHKATPYVAQESALPLDRITQSPPFSRCGCDYFGPFLTSDRGKVWGLIFICCTSRAVSLDCVSDMSAPTLMNRIRCLVARYGPIQTMYSDNAKSFKKVAELLSSQILWKFIPDRSPHWGGFYERLIGTIKSCLRKSIGRACLSLDNFSTLLVEIEGILNHRPLTYVGEDPSNPLPLRPMDLIRPKVSLPEEKHCSAPVLRDTSRRSRVLLNSFWNTWRSSYLVLLRKWRRPVSLNSLSPAVGHVVLVHMDNTKNRCYFPLGVITSLIVGSDGHVRAAWVRTARGTLRRAVHLLYPLEVPDTSALSHTGEDSSPSAEPNVRKSRSGRPLRAPERF